MSSIALVINDLGSQKAKSISLLMKAFGLNVGFIKQAVSDGSVIVEKKLFDRHDPQFPQELVDVLDTLTKLGCSWRALELLDGQVYLPEMEYFEITSERLRNMISAREDSLKRQRELGELEQPGARGQV